MGDSTLSVLELLHTLIDSTRACGGNAPQTVSIANALMAAVASARPPFALQFIAQSVFRDRQLIPVEAEAFERALRLGDIVHGRGAEEIRFEGEPSLVELLELAHELARPRTDRGGLNTLKLSHIRVYALSDVEPGAAPELASDVYVVAEVELALAAARSVFRHLAEDGMWRFSLGMRVIRRLHRAEESNPGYTSCALEVGPSPMDPARRALFAAHHASVVCRAIGMEPALHRSVSHAALLLALNGLRDRGGLPFQQALEETCGVVARSLPIVQLLPHTVQVAALIRDAGGANSLDMAGLVQLAYDLERRRRPEGEGFDLTIADVFADLLADSNREIYSRWLKLRLMAAGPLPPGSRVRLADGRRGVVAGASGAGQARPVVIVEGDLELPDEDTLTLIGTARTKARPLQPSEPPRSVPLARIRPAQQEATAASDAPAPARMKAASSSKQRAHGGTSESRGSHKRGKPIRREEDD